MRRYFLLASCALFLVPAFSQINTMPTEIKTLAEAKSYVKKNSTAELLTLNSEVDTTGLNSELVRMTPGDSLTRDGFWYLLVDSSVDTLSRVSCVVFNSTLASVKDIRATREKVIEEYKAGKPFDKLVRKYSIDKKTPDGDFDWIESDKFVAPFHDAIYAHKKGDIFTVDVPDNKWYYVVLKSYDDRFVVTTSVLKVRKLG